MKHVFFMPWIGKEYATGGIFGKRILVLGESHYGDGEPSPDTTVRVFEEYLDCPETVPSYLQSFHKFERSLVGKNTDCTDRKRIWDSVVFYNYLQTPMSGPRQGGKKSDYANSSEAFFEVLEEYRPEYIIVWGYRLWDNMPTERWKWGEELMLEGVPVRTGGYLLADGTEVKAVPVKHPSTAYAWTDWHKDLQPFLHLNDTPQNSKPIVQENTKSEKPISDTSSRVIEDKTVCCPISDKIICRAIYSDLPADIRWKVFDDDVKGIITEPYNPNIPADELIPKIGKAFRQAKISWDSDEKGYKRTVGIFDKLGRNAQLQHGQMLISLYLNTYCARGKEIHTQVENEPVEHPFSDAPEKPDYQTNINTSSELLKDGIVGSCVFSAENKERAKEPFILCQTCNGSGKMKCPSCGGSGREQYVDGYYASGEERIKTGICSDCSGSGKVDCPECNGLGKIEIFAPYYSVIRCVPETISQVACCAYTNPWESDYASCYIHNPDSSVSEYDPEFSLSKAIQQYTNNDEFLRIRMKNRKTTVIDNTQQIIRAMTDACIVDLYKKNEHCAKKWFADNQRGAFVSQHVRHYLLPISRLDINISKHDSVVVYLLPHKQNSTIAILYDYFDLPETGILKYLSYKLFK